MLQRKRGGRAWLSRCRARSWYASHAWSPSAYKPSMKADYLIGKFDQDELSLEEDGLVSEDTASAQDKGTCFSIFRL